MTSLTIKIRAMVGPGERAAVEEAAALLKKSLSTPAGETATIHCEFVASLPNLTPSSEPCILIASLLPEVANFGQPWSQVAGPLSASYRHLSGNESSPLFLCSVFRYVAGGEADAQSRLIRIRRLNLLATELSRETGCFVIDLDRCLADVGGIKIGADYRLEGLNAARVVGREIALAIVSAGLDAYASIELQSAAKLQLSQADVGLSALRGTEALPSNMLALGSGRRKQVVATVVNTNAESHVSWLFHLLLSGRLSPWEVAAKAARSIANRGLWVNVAMVVGAVRQRLSGRLHIGR